MNLVLRVLRRWKGEVARRYFAWRNLTNLVTGAYRPTTQPLPRLSPRERNSAEQALLCSEPDEEDVCEVHST